MVTHVSSGNYTVEMPSRGDVSMIGYFHKHTKLTIMTLMSTLYSHIFSLLYGS